MVFGKNISTEQNEQLTMISGFFSAISSFAQTVGNFGQISELKMTTDIKFSFFKPRQCEDLLFIGSTDNGNNQFMIENLLKRISSEFIRQFPILQNGNWCGETDIFKKFDACLDDIVDSEITEIKNEEEIELGIINNENYTIDELRSILHSDQPSFFEIMENLEDNDLSNSISTNRRLSDKMITELIAERNYSQQAKKRNGFEGKRIINQIKTTSDSFYNLVPVKKIDHDTGIYDIFAGEDSVTVFKELDGNHNIESLGKITGISQERVFNLCKGFIKMGLVSFSK